MLQPDGHFEEQLVVEYNRVSAAKKLLVKIASMKPELQEDPVYMQVLTLALENLRSQVQDVAGQSFGLMDPKRLSSTDWMAIDSHVKALSPTHSSAAPLARNWPEYTWLKGVNSSINAPEHPQMLAETDPPLPTPWAVDCIARIDTGTTDIVYLYPGAQSSDSVGAHGNIRKLFVPSRRFIYDDTASKKLELHAEWRWDADLAIDPRARAFMLSFLRSRMKRVDSRANWRLDGHIRDVLQSTIVGDLFPGSKKLTRREHEQVNRTSWQMVKDISEEVETCLSSTLEQANAGDITPGQIADGWSDGVDYEDLNNPNIDKAMLVLLDILDESQVIDLDWLVPLVYTDDGRFGATNFAIHPGYAKVAGCFLIEAVMRNVHLAINYFAAGKDAEELTAWNFFVVDEA